jgi:hypothetical protein
MVRLPGVRSSWAMHMPNRSDAMLLDTQARCHHQALLDAILVSGAVPSLSVLADQLATVPEALARALQLIRPPPQQPC